jgi:formylglycine-generating enzyme required for sulfatase activity/beta-lactam-binding protein with PASTA domain
MGMVVLCLVFAGCTEKKTVPNVVGLTQPAASSTITGIGLMVGTVTEIFSATVPLGSVISQMPAAGESASPGTAVNLTVSKGPQPVVTVPNVVGLTRTVATTALTNALLSLGAVEAMYSPTVAAGVVISQNPAAGDTVGQHTAVALTVSKGPQPVAVPGVVGQAQAAAADAIVSGGLVLGAVTQQPDETASAGIVMIQTPAAGAQVAPGTVVSLVVSSGPELKADFLILPAGGPAPLKVQCAFSNPARAIEITEWSWDFNNDGVPDSTDPNPVHTYTEPGSYSIELTVKTATGGTLSGTSREPVEVRQALETVIRPEVVVVDNIPELSFVSKTDTELVLQYSGAKSMPICVDDIVVGTSGDGYARRVQAIAQDGQNLVMATGNVPLTDIAEQGDLSSLVTFTGEDMAKAGFQKSGGGQSILPFNTFSLGSGVKISGSIGFEPSLDFDCQLSGIHPKYLRYAFVGTLTADFQATLETEVDLYRANEVSLLEALGRQPIKKWTVGWIGSVPVVIHTVLDIKAGYEAGVKGGASVGAGYSSSTKLRFGAKYDQGAWSKVNDVQLEVNRTGPNFTLNGCGYAKVYLKPEGKMYLYGVVGPKASLEPYLRTDFTVVPPPPELSLSAGVDVDLEFSLVDLSCIDVSFDGTPWSAPFNVYATALGRWPLISDQSRKAKPTFDATPLEGTAPLTVTFTDKSDPGDGTITGWHWIFADGSVPGTQKNPTHTYTKPGQYCALMNVSATAGTVDWCASKCITVRAQKVLPTAAFSAKPTGGAAPLTVQLTDNSIPGSAPISQWAWDFNDDGTVESLVQNPQWTCDAPGKHDVRLLVTTDEGGDTCLRRGFIVVEAGGAPAVSLFQINGGASMATGPTVTLNNTCAGSPTDYQASESADFGGASWQAYSTAPSFTITSSGTGTKTVYFKVRNAADESAPVSDTITLNENAGTDKTVLLPGGVPLEMVWIPGGTFTMGSRDTEQGRYSDEGPQYSVTLSGFWMGKYELTKRQWTAVAGTTPWSGYSYVLADLESPAVYVSWNDAQSFLTAVNSYTGKAFGLPSEAQWEYACRGGTTTRFYWGDDPSYTAIGDYAWYDGNAWFAGQQYAHVVGTKLPNAFGLYDMSGSLWEWCEDDWHDNYTGAPVGGQPWVDGPRGSYRVLRGGCWYHSDSNCRSAYRGDESPDSTDYGIGFRVALTP